ncbi:hypothetical protein L861_11360 [Litchfieldella anticariensis FP35 = DSM 16096]|uniref:DUF3261 domain-containing protein n=1 Tax=Litchfieldella anticariensis (strain DSM 16096 / CECT 5854 / CIP 108499 / LMG 22089 / FP35) TaxID=1121939 RepID=S2KGT8_LITA3|nr:DUF3261 domain-containing protein [Halomonas anticariensis]EPC01165.1 hypothetical protein L861_11360 [Halomonas anticariensis FP35 = DSM 16096]
MRRPFLRHALLTAIFAQLIGCAGQPANAPPPELAALPEMGTRMQRLTFDHQGQRHELIGVLRHDDGSLRLAMLSPQGQRLLTLVHDDHGARFLPDTSFDPPFSAEWLASRLAWSLWPSSALTRAFDRTDWSLVEDREERTIRYRSRTIAHIMGNAECRIIDDFEGDYRLYIAPLDDDANRTAASCPAD